MFAQTEVNVLHHWIENTKDGNSNIEIHYDEAGKEANDQKRQIIII